MASSSSSRPDSTSTTAPLAGDQPPLVAPPVVDAPGEPILALGEDDQTVVSQRLVTPSSVKISTPSAPFALGQLLAGERLNHFELLNFVGGGGMGAVFRARDTLLNREVAIKVLSRDQAADDETKRRFQNEAQSAARLDHENIARVHYVGEDKGLNYIVFEYIEGQNVRVLIEERGGPLSVGEAISITVQVAKALDHAFSRDVVHRDIKPSNIILMQDGKAKLVDMGLARLHDVDAGSHDLTASGVTLGTFDYISPEQARDPRSADVRSDLYSLGCTLFFMLTRRPPFPEGTVLQKLLQHNSDAPPDPREFNPEVPDELAAIVARLLAKNPTQRYQTPSSLIQDLVRVAAHEGIALPELGSGGSTVERSLSSAWDRHLAWIVPVAVLLAIVVGVELNGQWEDPLVVDLLDNPSSLASLAAQSSLPEPAVPEVAPVSRPGVEPSTTPVLSVPSVEPPADTKRPAETAPAAVKPMTDKPPALPPMPMPAEGSTTPVIVTPAAAPADRWIVTPTPQGAQQVSTLSEAVAAARNGDTIELHFSGPRDARPIELRNRRLTIRAGEHFAPTLVFRPDEVDPLRYPRSMISALGGRISLINLGLELIVPSPRDVPSESWSLLETQRTEWLDLRSCLLTIRNAAGPRQSQHPNVSFLQVRAAAGLEAMMEQGENRGDDLPGVQLENCVVRGEAMFLRVADLQPLRVLWNNGLLATSERFLSVVGGPVMPRNENRVEAALRHVTLVVGEGLVHCNGGYNAPYLMPVSINCRDSLLVCGTTSPLIEHDGIEGVAAFQRQLTWNGSHNTFQGFDRDGVWRFVDAASPSQSLRWNVEQWDHHWGASEQGSQWSGVVWDSPPAADVPLHQQTPGDFRLSTTAESNPPRNGASNGSDQGLLVDLLPRMSRQGLQSP